MEKMNENSSLLENGSTNQDEISGIQFELANYTRKTQGYD